MGSQEKFRGDYGAMIVFDKLWESMKRKGVSTYKLREHCLIDSRTVKRLRENGSVETKTLDKICGVFQ